MLDYFESVFTYGVRGKQQSLNLAENPVSGHLILACIFITLFSSTCASQITNIHSVPDDLTVPVVTEGKPSAGRRVWRQLESYQDWQARHALYLPADWQVTGDRRFPVIVEYPGNGGYRNKLGDESLGRVEDCRLGFGMSGGKQFIWVCLPFLDPKTKRHALKWWGDPDLTAQYCREVVEVICRDYRGDPDRVVLAGFSRGAIACGYIGLRDVATAKLWRAMVIHSHYDGVRRWGYADDDAGAARTRLQRFAGKPQFVSHERSVDAARRFLAGSNVEATFLALPFPNHTDTWVLKDLPERRQLREWLKKVLE